MPITIPDKIAKLLIALGLLAFCYAIVSRNNHIEKYYSVYDVYYEQLYKVKIFELKIERDIEELKEKSNTLSLKYNEPEHIINKDSLITFTQTLKGTKKSILITETLAPYWKKYLDDCFQKKIEKALLEKRENNLESEERILENHTNNEFLPLFIMSMVLFIGGFTAWVADENKFEISKQEEKIYKYCQSCGEEFTSMRTNGKNKDKTLNRAFCKICFKAGKFTNPDLNKSDFLENAMQKYNNKSFLKRRIKRIFFTNLERWKE